jgi:hypothetical protein
MRSKGETMPVKTRQTGRSALSRIVDVTEKLTKRLPLLHDGEQQIVKKGLDELEELIEALPPYIDLGVVAYLRNRACSVRRSWEQGELFPARHEMQDLHRRLSRLHAKLT